MKNLFKALAAFQQDCPVILKDTTGYGYKYADLPQIFNVINPLLKKHGLGFYQSVEAKQLKTVVFHIESGELIESCADIPQEVSLKGMNDFQVLGSAITYMRRYQLSSMLGIVTDKDTDASGQQVNGKKKMKDLSGAMKKLRESPNAGQLFNKIIDQYDLTKEQQTQLEECLAG